MAATFTGECTVVYFLDSTEVSGLIDSLASLVYRVISMNSFGFPVAYKKRVWFRATWQPRTWDRGRP